MKTLDDIQVAGKRVFLRVDFNVPLDNQRRVTDDLRLRAVLPSIAKVLEQGGKLILASHLGRPKGKVVAEMSLRPVGEHLAGLLGKPVQLAPDCVGAEVERLVAALPAGAVLLLENLRFHAEEEKNDEAFSRQLAALADVYVNDAFAVSHRAHASVHGITRFVPVCAAGYQLAREMKYFKEAMIEPARPLAVVIGGAKVSTKIGLLENLLGKADHLLIGGAMANTFLKAQGKEVGESLVEPELVETAKALLEKAAQVGAKVLLPVDAIVAERLEPNAESQQVGVDEVPPDMQILDVGARTVAAFKAVLERCGTVVWNGPLGAFETPPFHVATFELARFLGGLEALTVVGGGDSAAAVKQANMEDEVSYVSTGGGAFLELLEGRTLPGVAILDECGGRS